MKKILVVYNPVAGRSKCNDLEGNIKKFITSRGYDYTWYETATDRKCSDAITSEFHRVVVCGGDGTIACVVRALVEKKLKTPLIVVPIGSGNLLAMSLRLAFLNPLKALEIGWDGRAKDFDVMKVNDKYYGMVAVGRGYDALLIHQTPRELKRKLGMGAYVWMFLKTVFTQRSRDFTVVVDGVKYPFKGFSAMIFNTFPLPFIPYHAQDGMLNVVVLTCTGLLKTYRGKVISITVDRELKFQIDGEAFHSDTLNVEIVPNAIRLMSK